MDECERCLEKAPRGILPFRIVFLPLFRFFDVIICRHVGNKQLYFLITYRSKYGHLSNLKLTFMFGIFWDAPYYHN